MAASSLSSVVTRKGFTETPQNVRSSEDEVLNSAGGYTFKVEGLERVKRFLVLGSEKNYYQPGTKLAAENANAVVEAVSTVEGAHAVVDLIVEYSTKGRTPKQDYGLFALAIAANPKVSADAPYALVALPAVARTATTLFQFITFSLQFRGWGRSFKRAVAEWYTTKAAVDVAFQITKYRNREGWTHRDVFRTSHPVPNSEAFKAVGDFILRGEVSEAAPEIIKGYVKAQVAGADLPALVREYHLAWEMLPTESLKDAKVWEALIETNSLPLGALLRQLPRLTNLGFFEPYSDWTSKIVAKLSDEKLIKKSRIHPIAVLVALHTYASGEGRSQSWNPSQKIVSALDKMFYKAFDNVEPTGKKFLIGLDVSGSMSSTFDQTNVSSREITSAIAAVLVATEPEVHVVGFTAGSGFSYSYRDNTVLMDLDSVVAVGRPLQDIMEDTQEIPFGGTDCALPMLYALERGLRPEVFVIMTDNETWAGKIKPHEALAKYRRETGIDAKLIILSTEATRFSIADPTDAGMLDIAGFDSAFPSILKGFVEGDF